MNSFSSKYKTAETLTDDQNTATDDLEKWIENRRFIIETFIANGGAEGFPGSVECFDEKLERRGAGRAG